MYYLIFGAGNNGKMAMDFLDPKRVKGFIDNNKTKTEYCQKTVFSFEEFLNIVDKNYIVVIASKYYYQEIEKQLLEAGIDRYFVFDESHCHIWYNYMPAYWLNKKYEIVSYNRVFEYHHIDNYKKIVILGNNELVPYLISDICFQSDYDIINRIIDKNLEVSNHKILGIPLSSDLTSEKMDCLIVNKKRDELSKEEFEFIDNLNVKVIDMYETDYIESSFYNQELKKYKDIHKGKRVFIIGNGPSLRYEDLDKLYENNEICIASNKIFLAYNHTKWRPNYLAMYDQNVVEDCMEIIPKIKEKVFIGDSYHFERPYNKIKGVQYFHCINSNRRYAPNLPKFSNDFCKGFYEGYTVTYSFGLQFAAYTGAKEVYLIGCDHNIGTTLENNHFIKDYYGDDKEKYKEYLFSTDDATLAYEAAERYSRRNNFRIYNATRGGNLEVFERVDFDSLF